MKWALAVLLPLTLVGGSPLDIGQSDHWTRDVQLDARAALAARSEYTAVPNGQTWYDTDGNPIEAFGGGFLKVDSWYYWVGQPFSAATGPPYDPALVSLYKSQDLLNWEHVGSPITVYTPDANGVQQLTYCQVQRPKLLYNAKNKKYVLWAHWELATNYDASQVFVATADNVEGPYILGPKGHFRPGSGNQDPSAMGDRVGGLVDDTSSAPKSSSVVGHSYSPVPGTDYPPKVTQYGSVSASNPQAVNYVSASTYGEASISDVEFNLTLKAVSVQMTPWDTSFYEKYSANFSVSASTYIIRYPTTNTSEVSTTVFAIGDPGSERTALVGPEIRPGLDESPSNSTVFVHSGDAAFITCNTTGSTIYYTTDGSDPTVNSTTYAAGTRISITGSGLTVKAICTLNGEVSSTASQVYTVVSDSTAVPIFRPIVNLPSGTYAVDTVSSVRIYCPTYNTECYYTMDGLDPEPPVKGTNIGYRSRDQTVWQDPKDGTAYLFSASDNVYGRVWQLDDDFTDVVPDKEYDVFSHVSREAPTVIRNKGTNGEYVYLITSTQSGWFANQGQYVRTSDITAGFDVSRDNTTGYRNGNTTWSSMQPVGDPSTYWSQSTFIINIGTDASPVYVYVGDRYDTVSLFDSTYVFIQLTINDTAPAVTGATDSGLMTLTYNPSLQLSVSKGIIVPPTWKLLSLNKPVVASPSVQLTAAEIAAGTYNYSAQAANDGINYDVNAYDTIQEYYKPTAVPFYWYVDLGQSYSLAWIGLSFQSIGGSDAVNRYTISGSNDASSWTKLVDNTDNLVPGFQSHILSGNYRYVRLDDYSIYDVDHGKEADWESGVYEISVYGNESGSGTTTSTTSKPTPTSCNHDNCLRQLIRASTWATSFCATYTTTVNTVTTGLPTKVANCQANPSRISSACRCINTTTA